MLFTSGGARLKQQGGEAKAAVGSDLRTNLVRSRSSSSNAPPTFRYIKDTPGRIVSN